MLEAVEDLKEIEKLRRDIINIKKEDTLGLQI